MSEAYEQNRLLACLDAVDARHLIDKAEAVELAPASVLYEPGDAISHVYFPLTGIISLIVVGTDGSGVEAATVGNEGVIGLGGLLAGDASFTRQIVQLPGTGVRIGREPFLAAVNKSITFRRLLAAHSDAFTAQLIQSAACSAQHDVEQRLSRWLLTTTERAGQTTLPFTHNAIAELLGVRRPTVTLAARMLQNAGVIEYRRGVVTVVERAGLNDVVCECYGIIRKAYDQAYSCAELP